MAQSTGPERVVGAERVLAVLTEVAQRPDGVSLDELAQALESSKPTVHRALASLRRAGFVHQVARGHYRLGDEFLRLAFLNAAGRSEEKRIQPALEALAERFAETAHFAVLDGSEIVYRAKVDPAHGAVRLTSVVGGRNPAYRTAVGKLLLSYVIDSPDELRGHLGDAPLESRTANTVTSIDELWKQLQIARRQGFAVDDQENEVGVTCIAVPVFVDGGDTPIGAVSVSALSFRTPLHVLADAVGEISATVRAAVTH